MKEFSMAWLIFSTLIRESPKDVYNKEELLNLMGRILKEVNDIITLEEIEKMSEKSLESSHKARELSSKR